MKEEKRKGARTVKEVSPEILEKLNKGEIESVNLIETLAMNQQELIKNVMVSLGRKEYAKEIITTIENIKKPTVNIFYETLGGALMRKIKEEKDENLLQILSNHISDSVRTWAIYIVRSDETLDTKAYFDKIKPFAADKHFGVREMAWLASRQRIIDNLEECIEILSEWSMDKNENIRRFASEATRPRGVWCKHIDRLKDKPELAIKILEPMKADSSKYVRDSVGNWLNDASKTRPEFVRKTCIKWLAENNTNETKHIVKKALRTIKE